MGEPSALRQDSLRLLGCPRRVGAAEPEPLAPGSASGAGQGLWRIRKPLEFLNSALGGGWRGDRQGEPVSSGRPRPGRPAGGSGGHRGTGTTTGRAVMFVFAGFVVVGVVCVIAARRSKAQAKRRRQSGGGSYSGAAPPAGAAAAGAAGGTAAPRTAVPPAAVRRTGGPPAAGTAVAAGRPAAVAGAAAAAADVRRGRGSFPARARLARAGSRTPPRPGDRLARGSAGVGAGAGR